VLAHLDGPGDARQALAAVGALLEPGGLAVVDGLGPAAMPERDLSLSVDWRRKLDGQPVVRRSQLTRQESPDGLRVAFSTVAEMERADGTIARLPADYRLWYPRPEALVELVRDAGLAIEATYGSHDLEALGAASDRCIVVARRPVPDG
jgi:hypothetical protein